MFAEVVKFRLPLIAATVPPLLVVFLFAFNGLNRRASVGVNDHSATATVSVEQMRESLARDRQLLTDYEKAQSALRSEVIRQRKSLEIGQASKEQVIEIEK